MEGKALDELDAVASALAMADEPYDDADDNAWLDHYYLLAQAAIAAVNLHRSANALPTPETPPGP